MIKKTLVLLSLSLPFQLNAVSFNCSIDTTGTEKLICTNERLSLLDDVLSAQYKLALKADSNPQQLKKLQLKWLRNRNKCATIDCIENRYTQRLNQLVKQTGASAFNKTIFQETFDNYRRAGFSYSDSRNKSRQHEIVKLQAFKVSNSSEFNIALDRFNTYFGYIPDSLIFAQHDLNITKRTNKNIWHTTSADYWFVSIKSADSRRKDHFAIGLKVFNDIVCGSLHTSQNGSNRLDRSIIIGKFENDTIHLLYASSYFSENNEPGKATILSDGNKLHWVIDKNTPVKSYIWHKAILERTSSPYTYLSNSEIDSCLAIKDKFTQGTILGRDLYNSNK